MKVEWRKPLSVAITGATLLAAGSGLAWAQQADSSNQLTLEPRLLADQPTPPKKDWVDEAKNPTEWFKWGADLRLRHEHLYNPFLLDVDPPGNELGFERYRPRVWGTVSPVKWLDFNTRLTWEGRHYWLPDSRDEWDDSDIVWDHVNFKLKCPEFPATLTVGRQDIILGDGWLVLDGTPLDGSRTIYFDLAARLNMEFKEAKTTVDLIAIQQWSDPDQWLSPIFSKSFHQTEQDEFSTILYVTNKSIDKTQLDGYFIYYNSNPELYENYLDIDQFNGDDAEIYVFGGRVAHDFNAHWKARVEAAYQFGDRQNATQFPVEEDVSAYGLNSQLAYAFNDQWKNQLKLSYEFLSGDDPDSSTIEQWMPLWGRWPQWSELYIYTYAVETRIAEVTNLHRVALGWQANPTSKVELAANYHALFAAENTRGATPGFSSGGDFRGHLFTGVARYKFNRFMAGHIMGEYFIPGDYYDEPGGISALKTREDDAAYLRVELTFTF